ncbi:MAG TPA: DUF4920 domain-containing protein [Geopsychrobacteraceae bacterium]|nr:DUF4920 domain-containing protein [Geopsychrobacteraceae bacterium]
MRTILITFSLLICFVITSHAGVEGVYGKGITLSEVTPISKINDHPEKYVGQRVLVEGMILEVCTSRGCWIYLSSDRPYEKMRVKVTDGEIVFPVAASGHTARVEGVVQEMRRSKQDVIDWKKHLAEEKGTTFDPSTVTGPEITYRLRGLGAIIN